MKKITCIIDLTVNNRRIILPSCIGLCDSQPARTRLFRRSVISIPTNKRSVAAGLIVLGLFAAFLACGQSSDTAKAAKAAEPVKAAKPAKAAPAGSGLSADLWDGWESVRDGLVQVHYPTGHPLTETIEELVADYSKIIKRTCNLLNTKVPTDTLHVMYYTGVGQGRELTGREFPFAVTDTIHFWLPSFLGVTLMHYLIPKWQPEEPRYQFFKHGVITTFDYSGQNYHKTVMRMRDSGDFMPLAMAVLDTTIDSNIERKQSAEAASFVEFILRNGGAVALDELYRSRTSLDLTVMNIFGISVDSLQTVWLDYAALRVPPDTASE